MKLEKLKKYEEEKVEVVLSNGFNYKGVLKEVNIDSGDVVLVDQKKGEIEIEAESVIVINKWEDKGHGRK